MVMNKSGALKRQISLTKDEGRAAHRGGSIRVEEAENKPVMHVLQLKIEKNDDQNTKMRASWKVSIFMSFLIIGTSHSFLWLQH